MNIQSIFESLIGTYCCCNDSALSFVTPGTSLHALAGYTLEDIEKEFENAEKEIKKIEEERNIEANVLRLRIERLKEENEENISKILKSGKIEILPIDEEIFKEIPLLPVTQKGTICVCPNELYEGFFIAKIRKK